MAENKENASPVDSLDAQILELQKRRDEDKEKLRELVAEREKIAAGAVWSEKVGNMNEAELAALQEAIAERAAKAHRVGVNGIESKEGVNGQGIQEYDTDDN